MITYTDICTKVVTAVTAHDPAHARGVDLHAITRAIIDRWGLVDIDARDENGDPIVDPDEFWEIVRSCDATQVVSQEFDAARDAYHAAERARAEARDRLAEQVRQAKTTHPELSEVQLAEVAGVTRNTIRSWLGTAKVRK